MKGGIARSISMRLSAISRLRKVPYQNLLTEFLLERLLARLVGDKKLSDFLIFKGGFVAMRAYGSPRYTVDLDALLEGKIIKEVEKDIISAVQKESGDGTWFYFEKTSDLETQGEYPGLRFIFRAGLGEKSESDIKRAQIVNFDIGVGDVLMPVRANTESLLSKEALSWKVYPRELIVAEKIHSFLSRPLQNSRSKDLYDLFFHLSRCDAKKLFLSAQETFCAREENLPEDVAGSFLALGKGNLKRGWASAVSGLGKVGSFEEVFSEVVSQLKAIFDRAREK